MTSELFGSSITTDSFRSLDLASNWLIGIDDMVSSSLGFCVAVVVVVASTFGFEFKKSFWLGSELVLLTA